LADNFLQLYEEYYDDIYRYVYCKTGNVWSTDDIVSEVFLKAFRHFSRTRGNHKAWLVTIARNATIDFFRRSGREVPSDVQDSLAFLNLPGDLEHELEISCLKAALLRLDPEAFELINLRFFCGLKFKEMGAIIGSRQETVKMRVYRILEQIRKKVESCLKS
jgi:RNA polymerase sigma-70 factor (ECF subfamily)